MKLLFLCEIWNSVKHVFEKFRAALWGLRFRDVTFSDTDWMRLRMKLIWSLYDLSYGFDLQVRLSLCTLVNRAAWWKETSEELSTKPGVWKHSWWCICICGHPTNTHTRTHPDINNQSTVRCNQGYNGLQPVLQRVCVMKIIRAAGSPSSVLARRCAECTARGKLLGMAQEIAGHDRYQGRHLTKVTDGATRDSWVLQVVEMEGREVGEGITRIKGGTHCSPTAEIRTITEPVVHTRAWVKPATTVRCPRGQVLFPMLADMGTQEMDGCSMPVSPCQCLHQTRWYW